MKKQFILRQPSKAASAADAQVARYERILVAYEDELMRSCQREFTGRVAQAVQHEIDYCNGVII